MILVSVFEQIIVTLITLFLSVGGKKSVWHSGFGLLDSADHVK